MIASAAITAMERPTCAAIPTGWAISNSSTAAAMSQTTTFNFRTVDNPVENSVFKRDATGAEEANITAVPQCIRVDVLVNGEVYTVLSVRKYFGDIARAPTQLLARPRAIPA